MAMTGLQIFKLLPKTNCGECGVPTCMAFAMKLAAKNAELAACPYASEEAIKTMGAASKPPIRLVKIGPPEHEVLVGNETVMFRHDKTFVHPTAIAIAFADNDPLTELGHKIAEVRDYCLERVGEQLRVNLVLVDNFSEEVKPFVDLVKTAAGSTGMGIILRSTNLEALEAGLKELRGQAAADPRRHAGECRRRSCPGVEVQRSAGGARGHHRRTGRAYHQAGRAGGQGHRPRSSGRQSGGHAAIQHPHPQGGAEEFLRAAGLSHHQLRQPRSMTPRWSPTLRPSCASTGRSWCWIA